MAEICAEKYPVKESVRYDTLWDFLEVECPDYTRPDTNTRFMFENAPVKVQKLKPGVNVIRIPEYITKTATVKDSAEVVNLSRLLAVSNADKEKYRAISETRQKWLLWLVVALAFSLLLNIIQIKR